MIKETDDKVTYAYNYIKSKIINYEYKPHQDISDSELQEELNMSRTPIREALQRLESEYFVNIYPRKGTFVTEIEYSLLNSVYEARLLNEPKLAAKSCYYLSESWCDYMLNKFTNPPRDTGNKEFISYYTNLDESFHNQIISVAKNQFIVKMLRNVSDHSQRIRVRSTMANTHYSTSVKEHTEIIEAIKKRDEKKIIETYSVHLSNSWDDALEYVFPYR